MYVVERLIDAVARIEYPRDRMDIQVLDDSTDETQGIAARARRPPAPRGRRHRLPPPEQPQRLQGRRAAGGPRDRARRVRRHLRRGLRARRGLPAPLRALLHRRKDRHGAGALGPPEPRLSPPHPGAGHLPRRPLRHRAHRPQPQRPLLQLQRHRRRLAPRRPSRTRAAGSTTRSPKTSTSPTARSSPGWHFVYLPHVVSPAEVPVEMIAFKSQQHRWAKGSIQTARKLLPRILEVRAASRGEGGGVLPPHQRTSPIR